MAEEVLDETYQNLTDIGKTIRAQREKLNLSIKDVQDQTKIRSKYLAAIEMGNDKIAPGEAYFRVFLKSYADFLGLDGSAFARIHREMTDTRDRRKPSIMAETSTVQVKIQTRKQVRRSRRKRDLTILMKSIILLVVIVGVVFGGMKLFKHFRIIHSANQDRNDDKNGNDLVQPPQPDHDGSVDDSAIDTQIIRTDPTAEVTVFETNETPLNVVLETLSGKDNNCWIQIKADDEMIMERTMDPGESVKATAENLIEIIAGKPWVLTLELNDQDLGIAGSYGPVKNLIFRYDSEL